MNKIVMISEESFSYVMDTLRQCREWLRTDARYSHSNSNIRAVSTNVIHSIDMMYSDAEKFKSNSGIINDLNKENKDEISHQSDVSSD